jgi:hypothetical protein
LKPAWNSIFNLSQKRRSHFRMGISVLPRDRHDADHGEIMPLGQSKIVFDP